MNDYCCTVCGLTSNCNIERNYKLQKCTAKLILNKPSEYPSISMFKELNWMTIFTIITHFQAKILFA